MRFILPLIAITASVPSAMAGETTPDAARQAELVRLVRQDCGFCHGLTLKGGLGPPLLPAPLAGKDSITLESTILHGRPGTPMPPWKGFLSEADVRWIVEQLKKGFPDAP